MLPVAGSGPGDGPYTRRMATIDHAPPAGGTGAPGFWWRVLSPIGAVLLAFACAVVGAGILSTTPLSTDSAGAVLAFVTSGLILLFALVLWRGLPEHERRAVVAVKRGGVRRAVAAGAAVGAGIVVGAGIIIAVGSAIDPVVERRIQDVEDIGTAPWQLVMTICALVVLAPLGEELLFRGLLLRALVQRMRFWRAALVSSVLFASAHLDTYLLWPRAIALVGTGVALAWINRRRGYWASVAAHATVNTVASIALVITSSS
jgi:membrane protease YdiL (CAAX protease family)